MKHRNIIQHAIRGCKTLPKTGSHPGTPILVIAVAFGALVGAENEACGAFAGSGIMAAVTMPFYLIGAVGRSQWEDEREES